MKENTYNGWTNYATWRVNLELFDGFNPYEHFGIEAEYHPNDLGEILKDYAEDLVIDCIRVPTNSLCASYARAFLSDVNWTEIAQCMIDAYETN